MNEMNRHYTYKKLIQSIFPSIVMMIFTSIYGVVDGLFVSNFAGKTAFAAVNFIYPYLMVLGGVGFMFGTGGSALVAKTMGEGNHEKANGIFSSLIYVSVFTGIFLGIAGLLILHPVARWMGAEGQLLEDSILYGGIYLLGVPATVVQYEFQNLYVTAGKPKLGLYSTVVSGVTNIMLDALFVAVFSWNLAGAAAATVISQCIGGIFPLIYFSRKNTSPLQIVRTKPDGRAIMKICSNGFSELLNNISMSVVSMIYNIQLLRYAGDDGVAAFGVLMYVDFLFMSVFIGYTVGVSPLISFHYGAHNRREVRSLLIKSNVIIGMCALCMFLFSELLAMPVSRLFVGYDQNLMDMTLRGFLLYSFTFLFSGYAMFGSSFFTALNNGLISAVLSFVRVVVLEILLVLILPVFWELDGIWLSVVIAEFLAAVMGGGCIFAKRKKYHYDRCQC